MWTSMAQRMVGCMLVRKRTWIFLGGQIEFISELSRPCTYAGLRKFHEGKGFDPESRRRSLFGVAILPRL
jgi:hypothetical protein